MRQLLLLLFLVLHVEARTWTDINGRTMQADLVRADITSVTVRMNGKDVKIPLIRLSEKDQDFIHEWLKDGSPALDEEEEEEEEDVVEERPAEKEAAEVKPAPMPSGNAGAASGGLTFDGKPLEIGGKLNLYEYPYDEEYIATIKKKHKAEDTGYRITIAVPAGFDPKLPQKVFIAMAAGNNAGQMSAGNTAALRSFAGKGIEEGWVCIAYDSNLGIANIHDGSYRHAIDKILAQWPAFSSWTIAIGGSSGGSKATQSHASLLTSKEIPVRGIFLAGCNSGANMTWGRDAYKVSKASLRDIRCFISTGKKDNLVSTAQVASVVAALRENGMRTIKESWFEGGHEMNRDQFVEALKWFVQDAP